MVSSLIARRWFRPQTQWRLCHKSLIGGLVWRQLKKTSSWATVGPATDKHQAPTWCDVMVVWLYLAVPGVCLRLVIAVFLDHTQFFYCDFITFPFGILGQVWYLIVSIPDPCCLSYFVVYCQRVQQPFESETSVAISKKKWWVITVNSEIFARILFSRIVLNHIFATLKIATRVWFTNINKIQSEIANSWGLYFHETSHMRSFAKIRSSRKFPNLQ